MLEIENSKESVLSALYWRSSPFRQAVRHQPSKLLFICLSLVLTILVLILMLPKTSAIIMGGSKNPSRYLSTNAKNQEKQLDIQSTNL